jgi:peptide-methionine (S)-S-oxide reductase
MTQIRACFGVLLLLFTVALVGGGTGVGATGVKLPDPALDDAVGGGPGGNTIVLAGGCFWGVEEVFQHVRGVTGAVSGYSGGSARTANYDMVSTGTSGHAESVKISYDRSKITLGQIYKVFFSVVLDPTQLNRQGPDTGPQYRSAIFFANERQQQLAKAYIDQLAAAHVYRSAIVTQIVPLIAFYEAEADHQDFAAKNPFHRYIMFVDKPKVDDLKKEFPALYK